VYDAFSRTEALASVVADLQVGEPLLLQSMHIFKQPRIGGEVTCHQDATFLWTEPDSVVGLWFALEDATLDNGCLWAEPGGHRGPLRERFVREGERLQLETLDRTPWPDQRTAVPLPCEAGTLIVFHGLLPHYSAPNRSARSRLAYTLHATDGRNVYAASNWLQRPAHQNPMLKLQSATGGDFLDTPPVNSLRSAGLTYSPRSALPFAFV
jgi:phytanoyl-CoA hydroxylase